MLFVVLILAVTLDLILGEPPSTLHPTVWMGKQIGIMEGISQRFFHRRRPFEFMWGCFIILSGAAFWGGLLYLADLALDSRFWLSLLLAPFLLKVSFSLRYLLFSGREIRDALKRGDLLEARRLTSWHLVSRDTAALDEGEIASCVIESLSENITDSFTSPLFYYLVAGLPGAWCYRFINTSDAMIAYRTDELEWLGKFTAWSDSLLNLIPARLTGLMICAAAFLCPGASGRNAWRVMRRDRKQTASPNAGWTMAAMAGAVSSRLEKKGCYVLGAGMDLPSSNRIELCLRICAVALLLTLGLLVSIFGGGRWALNTAV